MKSYKEFVEAWEASQPYIEAVFQWLRSLGYDVTKKHQELTPDYGSRWEHTDDGDLEIVRIAEVKSMRFNFDSLKSYPYDDVIVNESYKIDTREKNQLDSHFICSNDMSCMLVVPPTTRRHWFKDVKYDRAVKEHREYYFVPKGKCLFRPLKKEIV